MLRSLKGIGKLDGALYKLVLPSSSYNTVLYAVSETSLWHSRLGHPSFHVLNKMPNLVCTRDCPQAPMIFVILLNSLGVLFLSVPLVLLKFLNYYIMMFGDLTNIKLMMDLRIS